MATSKSLYEKAREVIPGGVNSPVRAYKPYPFFASHASGSRIYDVDGNCYIDYCMAYGALLFGHAYSEIINAVKEQLNRGTLYGTPTEKEITLSKLIMEAYPSIEMVRLVNSGAEATMHSLRVARGYTGKTKIVKFEGCYHGAYDYMLVKAGSGATTFGVPTSLGIPENVVKNTLVVPYNDIYAFEKTVEKNKDDIAAVIIEPVIGNAGLILPKEEFLISVRKLTKEHDILLIFDEIITGFRLAFGGAQEYYRIEADLTCLGKILGGGFPIAAFGGKREIMEQLAPKGKVYQAGTFSGNAVSVTAALKTLSLIKEHRAEIYSQLRKVGDSITKAISDTISDRKLPVTLNKIESMFQIFFTGKSVIDYKSAQTADTNKFMRYHAELLKRGVWVPPSQFETCFISYVHSEEDVEKTIEAIDEALKISVS